MKELKSALTIDPGLNTGWCLWTNSTIACTGIFNYKSFEYKVEAINSLMHDFKVLLITFSPEFCYIEGVALWSSSPASVASAQRGDSFNLAYLVGAYVALCIEHNVKPIIIYPREWKGNMKKDIVYKRLERATGTIYPNHIADAVGIGLGVMGKL